LAEKNRPLVNPRLKWEETVKMDLEEIRCEDKDRIHLAQYKDQ
jgi:hypothetical protein